MHWGTNMDKIYFSASTDSFYFESLNGADVPTDSVVLQQNTYDKLMDGLASGKALSHDGDGNPILVDQNLPVEAKIEICKATAKGKLTNTDWSQTADIGELLLNQSDFTAYRAKIREMYFNPVPDPIWAEEPKAVWKA